MIWGVHIKGQLPSFFVQLCLSCISIVSKLYWDTRYIYSWSRLFRYIKLTLATFTIFNGAKLSLEKKNTNWSVSRCAKLFSILHRSPHFFRRAGEAVATRKASDREKKARDLAIRRRQTGRRTRRLPRETNLDSFPDTEASRRTFRHLQSSVHVKE